MALIAESLVEEWLNRQHFFTICGSKKGVGEIDLLGIRFNGSAPVEGWHVEVQVSFNPIGYISKLPKDLQEKHHKKPSSAWQRPPDVITRCANDWVNKKFTAPAKVKFRESLWSGIHWEYYFVHAIVKDTSEVDCIARTGIHIVPFYEILHEICNKSIGQFSSSSGGDVAEIVNYYNLRKELEIQNIRRLRALVPRPIPK